METQSKWIRTFYIIGVIAMCLGAIDPLEGSILIGIGSVLLAITTFLKHDKQKQYFIALFIMIIVGVFFLFYFSSLGGFGGTSKLSWWWGVLVLPYPIGWILSIILLISRARTSKRIQESA